MLQCVQCDRQYKSRNGLRKHVKHSHGNVRCICLECNMIFGYSDTLRSHRRSAHPAIIDKCAICGKVSGSCCGLRIHMIAEHNCDPSVPCTCFWQKNSDQLQPSRADSPVDPFIGFADSPVDFADDDDSDDCHEPAMPMPEIAARMMPEVAAARMSSPQSSSNAHCEKAFERESQLVSHRAVRHVHLKHELLKCRPGQFRCGNCRKPFKLQRSMRRHENLCGKKKPFACPVCQKTFTRRYALQQHGALHDASKLHQCEQCENAYTRASILQLHVQEKHSADPEAGYHACFLCEKTFTQASALSRHIHTHKHDAKACKKCCMPFRNRANFEAHNVVIDVNPVAEQHAAVENRYKQTCAEWEVECELV